MPGPLWRQALYDCSVAYLEFERSRAGPGEGREQAGTYCDAVASILQSAVAVQAAGEAPRCADAGDRVGGVGAAAGVGDPGSVCAMPSRRRGPGFVGWPFQG